MNDMYNTYDDNTFEYDYQTIFYEPQDLRCKGFWTYGDMVQLVFRIDDLDVKIDDEQLENCRVKFNFYNNRFEQLEYTQEMEAESILTLSIAKQDSLETFTRGIYYCSIEFEKRSGNEVVESQTILYREHCCFHVL